MRGNETKAATHLIIDRDTQIAINTSRDTRPRLGALMNDWGRISVTVIVPALGRVEFGVQQKNCAILGEGGSFRDDSRIRRKMVAILGEETLSGTCKGKEAVEFDTLRDRWFRLPAHRGAAEANWSVALEAQCSFVEEASG